MKIERRIWLPILALIGVGMAIGGWRWWVWSHRQPAEASHEHAAEPTNLSAGEVRLQGERSTSSGVRIGNVERRVLQSSRVVPGRVRYDAQRQTEILSATDGTITSVLVQPGDKVEQGQVVATLNSPEIGKLRSQLLTELAELNVVNEQHRWDQEIHAGVDRFAESLLNRASVETLRKEFAGLRLGKYRESMISAYSRYLLAKDLARGTAEAAGSGAISAKLVRERASEMESAEAALQGVIEQSAFEVHQQEMQSQVVRDSAERKVELTRHALQTLLGYVEDDKALEALAKDPGKLSQVEVRAPFAATIETNHVSVSTRVHLGDPLVSVADTKQLWVAADLRENDWKALELKAGDAVTVTTPALPDREIAAKVVFVGREVSRETNAVPLIVAIDNSDGLLRPGLFVWVKIPIGEARHALAVPESAVCVHEGHKSVFVAADPTTFRATGIDTGETDGEWVEVVSGVSEGEKIAVAGVFVLKSELTLEREE